MYTGGPRGFPDVRRRRRQQHLLQLLTRSAGAGIAGRRRPAAGMRSSPPPARSSTVHVCGRAALRATRRDVGRRPTGVGFWLTTEAAQQSGLVTTPLKRSHVFYHTYTLNKTLNIIF
eukprot:scaffold2482_cov407-Prasinococcus_capsulatus_cf.AAC.2